MGTGTNKNEEGKVWICETERNQRIIKNFLTLGVWVEKKWRERERDCKEKEEKKKKENKEVLPVEKENDGHFFPLRVERRFHV